MNFLAHAFLAAPNPDLQIGGFLGDFVRGTTFTQHYPAPIAAGIRLHREIDSFTDAHPQIRQCNRLLHPTQGKYAPVLTDLFFDHLLVRHWHSLSSVPFYGFVTNFYAVLAEAAPIFPPGAQYVQKRMRQYDWLRSYKKPEGVQSALGGLSRRVRFENQIAQAWSDFEQHEAELEERFLSFMPEVQDFVAAQKRQITAE